jgi:hypothetical protein
MKFVTFSAQGVVRAGVLLGDASGADDGITGMPAGVAGLHKPPAWPKPGSTVEVEVQNLGRLINPMIEGPASDA